MLTRLFDATAEGWRWIVEFGRNQRLQRILAASLLAAAVLSGAATYMAVTGAFGIQSSDREIVRLLYNLNLVLLILFAAVVIPQLFMLWMDRRSGLVGARLNARLVLWFGLVAMVPTLIISVLSVLYFIYGLELDRWLGDNVSTTVQSAAAIAQGNVEQLTKRFDGESRAMAEHVRENGGSWSENPEATEQLVRDEASRRAFDEVAVVDGNGEVLLSAGRLDLAVGEVAVPNESIATAREGNTFVFANNSRDRFRAVVLLNGSDDTFLVTGRLINPALLPFLERAQNIASFYRESEDNIVDIQTRFTLIITVMALLLLLAAVWAALIYATRLVRPISTLVAAADRIGAGNLDTRVPEPAKGDELGVLSSAFNRMTQQIETQRNELVTANRQLEERRRFTEVVLAGVSAGVIGLDGEGRVNLPNRSASDLLGMDLSQRIGEPIATVVPEMAALVEQARQRPSWIAEAQVSLARGAETRTLLVRVVAEFMANRLIGFVVTFDDVTELLSAQRKAAWADVARRIAHEIKNPLTPIQLSAERLKRKYLKEISSDRETFETCTDTIVRQVGDIGRMVDEFSSFARMPAPVMGPENVVDLCREAIFLQQTAHGSISYTTGFPSRPLIINCDAHQIGQALTNLLKNAAESIEARLTAEDDGGPPGRIHVEVRETPDDVTIAVEDNGRGLPEQGRERLTEPYVTTRARGTGLGLAIVKKIMEDHGGLLILEDNDGGGASVRLLFRQEALREELNEAARPNGLARAHGR
jgi:two-component system nitrogen regulation sensor histidine kinase NtrY